MSFIPNDLKVNGDVTADSFIIADEEVPITINATNVVVETAVDFELAFTGAFVSTANSACRATKHGDVVTLWIDGNYAAGVATTTISGTGTGTSVIPAGYRPAIPMVQPILLLNNALDEVGKITILDDGTFTIKRLNAGNFTVTENAGFYEFYMTYTCTAPS
jgi:hypothetical protein